MPAHEARWDLQGQQGSQEAALVTKGDPERFPAVVYVKLLAPSSSSCMGLQPGIQ